MWRQWIPFWQPGNSAHAADVDLLFAGLLAVSLLVLALLFFLLLAFAIRYRAGSNADRDHRIKKSWHWEVAGRPRRWSGFSACSSGARISTSTSTTCRSDALPIYVVAKQWMWKVQHPGGQREINELHMPVGAADPADHGLAGRDPQLLHAGVPHQARRRAGPLRESVVRGRAHRRLSPVLRGILRHRPFAHDRPHRRAQRRPITRPGWRSRT